MQLPGVGAEMAQVGWSSLRDAIITSFCEATTAAEREKCLADYQHVLGEVARAMELQGIEPREIEELRVATRKEYCLMLIDECKRIQLTAFSDNDAIDPLTLAALTTREVSAGRMQSTDEFHRKALSKAHWPQGSSRTATEPRHNPR
jgi:hypothetical protein